jgi:hypothetical protein
MVFRPPKEHNAMKKSLGVLVVALLLSAPAVAQKVHIDFDRNADFGSYKTFMYKDTSETSMADTSPLMHERAVQLIINQLKEGGLQQVESDPDLYVTYHTEEQEEMRLNTTSFGYGYGPSWYWDPYWNRGASMGSSTTTAYSYTRGTLIIDVWDARTNNLIFRGSATAVVPSSPQKGERQIQKSLQKMSHRFRKMRARDAKSQ